ncbi:PREDICTED: probable S-adenosylmethionine carrier 2, chloroplastic [Camelina sativa]|uniref:Probable S-adenosylmethionine carrier 2, chloroplastic n=1 Tax=Camelina sativa TaxID=90675 RepID=A0ABM0VFW7_CAMSA|nr:PREDICTED: probable S-adenosylmethionine carrier 2, chloroplastic [Camelina sativa]
MASSTKGSVKKGQPSIKHSWNLAEAKRKLSKISSDHHPHVEYEYAFQRENIKRGETKLSQILSRDSLISAVDLMWDRSGFVSGELISSLKERNLDDVSRDEVSEFKVLTGSTQLQKAISQSPSTTQPRVKFLRVAEKMCIFKPFNESFFSRFNQSNGAKDISSYREVVVVPIFTRYQRGAADRIPNVVSSEAECPSRYANSCDSVVVTAAAEGHSNLTEPRSPLIASVAESLVDTRTSRSNDVNYLFLLYKDRCANNKGVNIISLKCSTDSDTEVTSSGNNSDEDSLSIVGNKQLLERDRKDQETGVCSSSAETPTCTFAKQRHAFAGALAGISVSLCLHPLDTVKTMIQSCRLEEKSLCYTGRSILSERGVSGLYRGIASNIASSAPISALYTFTYESVKGALLPLFPKEYCSLTHCVAGGSASIATSFIFTPSERIKQQMQVGSHYRNCWTALVGIIQKGGLLSLYAGWTAVLCRNIPHSIIKFYVYENMKQMVLPSLGPLGQSTQPTTLQTLVCGGLAGSAAAFFTTPFDVVKTRLQTQIPGSRNQHPSVYQTLQSIRKQEGLRGLYRGLIPRLVMYMSQGAIFFASYEFYKSVLSLEAAQPNSSALSGTKTKNKDSSPPTKPSRLQHM